MTLDKKSLIKDSTSNLSSTRMIARKAGDEIPPKYRCIFRMKKTYQAKKIACTQVELWFIFLLLSEELLCKRKAPPETFLILFNKTSPHQSKIL